MMIRRRRTLYVLLAAAALALAAVPVARIEPVRMRVLSALRLVLGGPGIVLPASEAPGARVRDLNARLARAEDRVRSLEDELARTRELAGFVERTGGKALRPIAARVIARGARWSPDVVFIDAGEVEGVQPGSAVVVGALRGKAPAEGSGAAPVSAPVYAVGVVVAVGPRLSRVALLGARSVLVPARLVKSRLQGMIEGSGGQAEMRYVPARGKPTPGERVVTSGLGGVFPSGLYVGQVRKKGVKRETGRPFFRLVIEPAVRADEIGPVLVIRPRTGDLPPPPERKHERKGRR